jgi:plasmid stabilization system protein ParE
MNVVWTIGAKEDLKEIVFYIRNDSPDSARRVAKFIREKTASLSSMSYRGRKSDSDDALEMVFAPWPYVAVYEVIDQTVYIEGIRHTSRESWRRS